MHCSLTVLTLVVLVMMVVVMALMRGLQVAVAVGCPSDKAQAVQTGQRNNRVYDTANDAFHAAKYHRD